MGSPSTELDHRPARRHSVSLLSLLLLLAVTAVGIVAVWHATLNAATGLFVFTMVSGADEARLGCLLALSYSAMAVAAYLARGRHLTRPGADGLVRDTSVFKGRGEALDEGHHEDSLLHQSKEQTSPRPPS